MRMRTGKDEWTPTLRKLGRAASPAAKRLILSRLCNDLKEEIRSNIANEKQYDGDPMKSPSKNPRADGKFSKDYKWRYLKSYRAQSAAEKKSGRRQTKASASFAGGKKLDVDKVRGRVAVDASSKQLNFTGDTRKSVDILSVSGNRGTVGPKTGHGRQILSWHNATRRPVGISKMFAEKAQKKAFRELMKGVR